MAYDIEFREGTGGARLCAPIANKHSPGILVLHGSEGGRAGWAHAQAVILATQGFCAMALPYSSGGNPWHSGDIHEVDIDKTENALVWLKNHDLTNGNIGLFGSSRGGEHALLAATLMARDKSPGLPDAVAVHSPSDTICGAFIAGSFDPKGDDVWDPSLRAWRWRGSSENLLPTTPIAIEVFDGPIYISHGEQDRTWTVDCSRRLEKRLIAAGRTPEVHYYPDEGHGLSPASATRQIKRLKAFFTRTLQT